MIKEFYEKFPYPSEGRVSSDFYKFFLFPFGLKLGDLKGKMVLDAGCGTGEFSCSLAESGAEITAIDISSTSVNMAKALAKKYGVKNVDFRNVDVFDFKTGKKFDFVFSIGMIHHTDNPRQTFDKVCSFLKSDGTIVILLYSRYGRFLHNVRKVFKRKKNIKDPKEADLYINPLEHHHTLGEMREWFDGNGLEFLGAYPRVRNLSAVERFKSQLGWLLRHQGAFVVAGRKVK